MTRKHWTLAITAACALAAVVAPDATAADKGWTVDFKGAKATAAKDKKDLFLEFTGSDWCPPCMSLKKNILSKPDFMSEMPKHFVLVKLDYPNNKSHQTKEEIAQNKVLQAEYKISGFPTVILADETGRPYSRKVGFGGGSVADYVKHAVSQRSIREKRDELFAQAEKAEGADKAKLLDQGLSLLDSELVTQGYMAEITAIIAADADNAAGLKAKYEQLKLLPEIMGKLKTIERGARKNGIEPSLKSIDALLAEYKPEGQALQAVLFTKSSLNFQSGKKPEAKKLLEEALEAAPKSPKAKQIQAILKKYFP